MEANTQKRQPASPGEPEPTPGMPPDAPEGLRKADTPDSAKAVSPEGEAEAVRWLLGAGGKPMVYKVPVEWDTEDGMQTIQWVIHSLPGAEIDRIENGNRKDPDDPFSRIDEMRASAEIVAAATDFPDIRSTEFRTPAEATPSNPNREPDADPTDALVRVFKYQSGLLTGIAGQVRRISGWAPDRVGLAQRKLVTSVKNS